MPVSYGIEHTYENLQSLIPSKAEMSTAGLVLTLPSDYAGALPLNDVADVNPTDLSFYNALPAGGAAQLEIEGLNDQITSRSAQLVVTFVKEGASADPVTRIQETIANLKGDSVLKTGMHALTRAPQKIGKTPRLVAVPGYTSQAASGGGANPIAADMPGLLGKLGAIAFLDGPNSNRQGGIDWRETLPSSERMVPIETGAYIQDADGNEILRPMSGRAVGMQIRVDEEKGGYPFHALAGRDVFGITQPGREMDFTIDDADTEGQQLLAQQIGIVVRGEANMEAAVGQGGFQLIAFETLSTDPDLKFYNVVRGFDWMRLTQLKTLRALLGQHNISIPTMLKYARTIEAVLRLARNEGHIAGYQVDLPPERNLEESLADGEITASFKAQPFPVFRRGRVIYSPYRVALTRSLEQARQQLQEGIFLAA